MGWICRKVNSAIRWIYRNVYSAIIWMYRKVHNCLGYVYIKVEGLFFWCYHKLKGNELQQRLYVLKVPSNDPGEVCSKVLSKLKKDLRWSNVYLACERSVSEASTSSIPVLVFCLLTSRIGEDIDDALTEIDRGCNVMLMVIHFKRKFQLDFDNISREENLLEDDYHVDLRKRNRITHFAFDERDGGLYEHEQTSQGTTKLVDFFKS